MASDVHVSLVSSSIRFIITHHQSRRLSISLSVPSVALLCFPSAFFTLPPPTPLQPPPQLKQTLRQLLGVLNSSPPLERRSVPHLSPSLISPCERRSRSQSCAGVTHTPARAELPNKRTHWKKEPSRVMVFSVIYCTAVVASASSIGIITEIT